MKARHTKVLQYATNQRSATRGLCGKASIGECVKNSRGNDLNFTNSIDSHEYVAVSVCLDEWRGFTRIQLESVTGDVVSVVGSTLIRGAQSNPFDDDLGVGDEFYYDIELMAVSREHVVERPNLVECPRVAIQQKPGLAIVVFQTVRHERVCQRVRNVLTAIHEAFGLDTQRGLVSNIGAKDVASGNGGDTERLGQENGLSPLAGTRRADQEHTNHYPSSPS